MTDQEILEAMRAMIEPLRADIGGIRSDIGGLNDRMDTIEATQGKISADIAKLNHELVPKVNAIYDGFVGQRDNAPRLDVLEGRVDHLEDDVFAIKQSMAE